MHTSVRSRTLTSAVSRKDTLVDAFVAFITVRVKSSYLWRRVRNRRIVEHVRVEEERGVVARRWGTGCLIHGRAKLVRAAEFIFRRRLSRYTIAFRIWLRDHGRRSRSCRSRRRGRIVRLTVAVST